MYGTNPQGCLLFIKMDFVDNHQSLLYIEAISTVHFILYIVCLTPI